MSIGSLGFIGAVAGSPLAQIKGDADRAKATADAQSKHVDAQQKAEDAAGIGLTDGENHETHDRDADGRRFYEPPPEPAAELAGDLAATIELPTDQQHAVDPTGQSGGQLDLTG